MEIYSSEEQQVEAIKRFWQEYGKAIVAGVVIGLAGLYGWRYYETSQRTTSEQSSAAYAQLMVAHEAGTDNWLEQANAFVSANQKNSYALMAALLAAKEAVAQQKYDVAIEQLKWVQTNATDSSVKAIAQLRLARVQREAGDYTAALATLETAVPASFVSQHAELKGDILQLADEPAQAKSAYTQALATAGQNTQIIQIKLDELAHISAG